MERRQRLIAGTIWIAVAAVMATTLEPGIPSSMKAFAQLFVVIVSLLLGFTYVFDPWDVISRYHV